MHNIPLSPLLDKVTSHTHYIQIYIYIYIYQYLFIKKEKKNYLYYFPSDQSIIWTVNSSSNFLTKKKLELFSYLNIVNICRRRGHAISHLLATSLFFKLLIVNIITCFSHYQVSVKVFEIESQSRPSSFDFSQQMSC